MSRQSGEYREVVHTVEIGATEHVYRPDPWRHVTSCGLRFDYAFQTHKRTDERAEKKVACDVCRRIMGWDVEIEPGDVTTTSTSRVNLTNRSRPPVQ